MSNQNVLAQVDWAAIVIVYGPDGKMVLVYDEGKPLPIFWKFAGGRKEKGETPEQTASRELEEETGLKVPASELSFLAKLPKRNHDLYVYKATVQDFEGLADRGVEGECIAIFDKSELPEMVDFFPPHRNIMKDLGLLSV